MWKEKRIKEVGIGIFTFVLAQGTHLLPGGWSWRTETLRTVQFIGTLALFYGILRAHPRHKDKLLLVWLATAIYCALSMAIAGLQLWLSDGIFTAIFYPWTLAVLIFAMADYMYMEYVALTVGAKEAGEASARDAAAAAADDEIASGVKPIRSKSFSYQNERPTILVHGKSIQLP